jgi:hypothetical protein
MMGDDKGLQTGTYLVDAPCPRCGVIEEILVSLQSVLTQPEGDVGSIKVRIRGKARDHDCKQARLTVAISEAGS